MMFLLDLAFSVELIALGVGIIILVWSYRHDGKAIMLARVFGYIIAIAAVMALLCTSYYGFSYWEKGYFKSPIAPMLIMKKQMMYHNGMMKTKCRCMQRMDQQKMSKQ